MSVMPKPKIKHRDLPPRMVRRAWRDARGKTHEAYYYEHPRNETEKRKLTSLGTDLVRAKLEWARLEDSSQQAAGLSHDDFSVRGIYKRYIEWARNTQASKLAERTLRDREQYWRQLEPVFGATHVDGLASEHMLRYFDARTSKVSAKKEIKFLSVLCNWAKSRGWMRSVNPVEGTTRQMKVDEGRDVYVSDALYWLVYQSGDQIVRDCLDLALLCGLRPSEALGTKWADLHRAEDGSEELWIKLPKTMKSGVKIKRVRVVGDLKVLLDRVRARGIVGQTILCDEKGQKLLLQGKFRFRFHKAREAAKKHIDALAVELGVEKLRELGLEWFPFQFRDLRPKAATDKERSAGMAETRRFLGHTTERQTADYVRDKIGELTDPVSASPPEWMAKVLSPKTQSSA